MLSAPRLLLHLAFLGALQECYGNYLQEKILEGSCDLGDCVGGLEDFEMAQIDVFVCDSLYVSMC